MNSSNEKKKTLSDRELWRVKYSYNGFYFQRLMNSSKAGILIDLMQALEAESCYWHPNAKAYSKLHPLLQSLKGIDSSSTCHGHHKYTNPQAAHKKNMADVFRMQELTVNERAIQPLDVVVLREWEQDFIADDGERK